MDCEEASDLITALVDNEVSTAERSCIESHLSECPQCRSIYEEEQFLKVRIRTAAELVMVPSELQKSILADNRIFPKAARARPAWKQILRPELSWSPAWALAVVILIVFPAVYWLSPNGTSLSSLALESHAAVLARKISYVKTSDPVSLRDHLVHAAEGKFGPMAEDLSAASLYPVGGTVHEIDGRRVILVIFEGSGPSVICHTFVGTEDEAPKNAQVVFDPDVGVNFYTFSKGSLNAVMHRQGDLICIFTSEMPMPELLALARSKLHSS